MDLHNISDFNKNTNVSPQLACNDTSAQGGLYFWSRTSEHFKKLLYDNVIHTTPQSYRSTMTKLLSYQPLIPKTPCDSLPSASVHSTLTPPQGMEPFTKTLEEPPTIVSTLLSRTMCTKMSSRHDVEWHYLVDTGVIETHKHQLISGESPWVILGGILRYACTCILLDGVSNTLCMIHDGVYHHRNGFWLMDLK